MNAPRFSEVDVARQFSQDQQIQPGHQIGFERAGLGQFRIDQRRTQVGEQVEVLAQAQQPLLGPRGTRQRIVGRAAHCPEQDGLGRFADLQRLVGQRIALGVIRRTTDQGTFGLHLQPVAHQHVQYPHGLRGDFGTDAITGQHCNLLRHVLRIPQKRTGRPKRRTAGCPAASRCREASAFLSWLPSSHGAHDVAGCGPLNHLRSPPSRDAHAAALPRPHDGGLTAGCPPLTGPDWPAARARPGSAGPRRPGCRRRAAASARSRPAR